ncbi:MAG: NADH-quinone oxidoreductase subunit N [candidate division Zixibacteria bacterium]|nr:NADH-quinone oxidoreductase subunit N [candidate division Zixibacteria bacterium]
MTTAAPIIDLNLMIPEIFLFLWACLVFTYDLVTKRKSGNAVAWLALAGPVLTGILTVVMFSAGFYGYGKAAGAMFEVDPMAVFFKIIFLGAAFFAIGSSFGLLKNRIVNHRGEFFGLILLSTVGMLFLAASREMISLYVGLELTTIPLFVLAAFFKDDRLSVEAGIKYLIIGALSSALLLYGMSFLYGLGGTTDIWQWKLEVARIAGKGEGVGVILTLSVITILAGLGFKLALPPFHQWAPDVYQGAPTPVAAFLSVGSKAAGLVAFAKLMIGGMVAFWDPVMIPNDWGILTAILAASAMIVGNVVAVRQSNIKRMMAYSSIAQAGYIMVGMVALNDFCLSSVAFYMFAYMFANMGAFAVIALIEDATGSCEISTYAGLSRTSPALAVTMTVFLLSLTGIPPLAGFMAKYYVFAAAIQSAGASPTFGFLYWLVGVGLVTSVVALYYYANIIKQMYFHDRPSTSPITFDAPMVMVLAVALCGVVVFGLFPEPVLQFARQIPPPYELFQH